MADDYITGREFEGFGTSMRGEFKILSDNMTAMTAKIDMLVNGRVNEALMMGEVNGNIRSINDRLGRLEEERRLDRVEIDALWEHKNKNAEGKLKWVGDVVRAIIAVSIGAFLARYYK